MDSNKKKLAILIAINIIVLITSIWYYNWVFKCHYRGCNKDKNSFNPYCTIHTCKESWCNAFKNKEDTWCETHKAVHEEIGRKWREEYNKLPDCIYSGCDIKASEEGGYCVIHGCLVDGCKYMHLEGGLYCVFHTCKESGCFNKVEKLNMTCYSCRKKAIDEINAERRRQNGYSTKKNNKSYSMPDCDDYDSFEEFMDDWEGFMPDGSDAEDYWENW